MAKDTFVADLIAIEWAFRYSICGGIFSAKADVLRLASALAKQKVLKLLLYTKAQSSSLLYFVRLSLVNVVLEDRSLKYDDLTLRLLIEH